MWTMKLSSSRLMKTTEYRLFVLIPMIWHSNTSWPIRNNSCRQPRRISPSLLDRIISQTVRQRDRTSVLWFSITISYLNLGFSMVLAIDGGRSPTTTILPKGYAPRGISVYVSLSVRTQTPR